jgi:hypothetical protein
MTSALDRFKLTFQLTAHGNDLEVRARALRGQCRAETSLPPQEVMDRLLNHDPVDIPLPALRAVGQTLYQRLLAGEAARLVADILDDARRNGRSVHFELRFDPDQALLAQYPWEALADRLGHFLVRDGLVDVTRYICYPQPPSTLDMAFRSLPLLRIVASPRTLRPLVPINLPVERIETLLHATFEQLQRKLLIERIALWGLHFDGHGGIARQCGACEALYSAYARACPACGASLADAKQVGVLAFERDGDAEWITTEQLGAVLYNARVRLALLLACETGRIGDRLIFNGLAPGLILAGVPAVVGMQYPVSDHYAGRFANAFYMQLMRSNDVLEAMRTARALGARESWYSPVLYLRHLKPTTGDAPSRAVYHVRDIDTAVPAQVQAGVEFLVRLWIRRPETKPLPEDHLRRELGMLTPEPISIGEGKAEVQFVPVPGKRLRRGEVEVECHAPRCDVYPDRIRLFVDESLDAPPAIFTVRARKVGRFALVFNVWQEGGQLAALAHTVQALDPRQRPEARIETRSHTIPLAEGATEVLEVHAPATDAGSLALFVQTGPDAGRRLHLARPSITVGRASTNDLVLGDPVLSRQHAVIRRQDEGWIIADLGSTNGTFVNDVRLGGPRRLQPGDRIRLGRTRLLVSAAVDITDTVVPAGATPVSPAMPSEQAFSPPGPLPQARRVEPQGQPPPLPARRTPPPTRPWPTQSRVTWARLLPVLLVIGMIGVLVPYSLFFWTRLAPGPPPATPAQGTVVPVPTVTLMAGPTVTPTPSALQPEAEFLGDVTIPDGTVMRRGSEFVKTWRFRNSGQVSWGEGVRLIFVEGTHLGFESNQMQGPDWAPVPNVQPGETIDVSVDLVAPLQPGRYRSFWRLQLADGNWLEAIHYAEIVVR